MQAALITDKEKIEFVEFEPIDPESNQVVVDIIFCGICGTDIHSYQSRGLLGIMWSRMDWRYLQNRFGGNQGR